MADYSPPTETLPIFDNLVFLSGNNYITQNQADKRYLRYPNAQGTEILQAIIVNGTASFNSTLTMSNLTSSSNRKISSSYYVITDSNIAGVLTNSGQIFSTGSQMYIQNDYFSSTTTLVVKDGSGNAVYPIAASSTLVTVNTNMSLASGKSLFTNGTGIISQQIQTYSPGDANSIKKTNVIISSGTTDGTGDSAMDIYDSSTTVGRGFFFMPNTGLGSLNPMFRQFDAGICGRAQNNGYLTMTNWGSQKVGFRCGQSSATSANASMEVGNVGSLTYDYSSTTSITSCNLVCGPVGSLSYNYSGTTNATTCNLTCGPSGSLAYGYTSATNTTTCDMVCGPMGFSMLYTSGTTPVYTQQINTSTLEIRNMTTSTNKLEIVPDGANSVYLKAKAASGAGILFLNAYNGSTDTEVMNLRSTKIQVKQPIELLYSYPVPSNTFLGYQNTGVIAASNKTSVTAVTLLSGTGVTMPAVGIYNVSFNWSYSPVGVNAVISRVAYGINISSTAAFVTSGQLISSNFEDNTTVTVVTGTYQTFTTSANVYISNTTNDKLYFNYLITFTGATNISLGGNWNYTRLS